MRFFGICLVCALTLLLMLPSGAAAQARVLWFNGMPNHGSEMNGGHREKIASYLTAFENGRRFNATYVKNTRGGGLAEALGQGTFDILVLDLTDRRRRLSTADRSALQNFYAGGRRALMLDGSLAIRSMRHNPTTVFPGSNDATGNILINQLTMLAEAGGGILIGTDHGEWQANANVALRALLPDARFTGTTNPSTDGDFIGPGLLSHVMSVTARDILRHWESVPSQGEAPVGDFTAFDGTPVTLYSLVEAADKPGGGRKRPYISASLFPGKGKTAIDSIESGFENLPTHKSGQN